MQTTGARVEWTITDEAQEWPVSPTLPDMERYAGQESAFCAANRKEQRMAMLAVVLLLLLMGGWIWEKQNLVKKMKSELQAAVVQDLQARSVSTMPTNVEAESSDPETPSLPRAYTTVHGVEASILSTVRMGEYYQLGNQVMAQITVSHLVEGALLAHRETHFYQRITGGWRRIGPVPNLMGPLQILETEHFDIRYRAIDANVVYETAPRLEKLYSKLRRDFGLPTADAPVKYTVDIVPNGQPNWHSVSFAKRTITIPSPTLLSVPVTMTAATTLYQSLHYVLARLVILEAIDQYQLEWKVSFMKWHTMANALHLWALWAEGGPWADIRAEVVHWVYGWNQVDGVNIHQPLANRYAHLCRTDGIWQITPRDLLKPLACRDEDKQDLLAQTYPLLPTQTQARFHKVPVTLEEALNNTVATEIVIEYVSITYGREQLPTFIAALGRHSSLETLIPMVYKISTTEFEAGWQAYLEDQYGIK